MPMNLIDPGWRPRRMLEDAEALELITRAANKFCLRPVATAAPAAITAAAAVVPVPLDPALANLFRQHSGGDPIAKVQVAHVQRLWGGMGAVLEVRAETTSGVAALLIVKKILLQPGAALSVGDLRKLASYECECRFFETMAGRLRGQAGCSVPAGLLIDRSPDSINIVMSKVGSKSTHSSPLKATVRPQSLRHTQRLNQGFWWCCMI